MTIELVLVLLAVCIAMGILGVVYPPLRFFLCGMSTVGFVTFTLMLAHVHRVQATLTYRRSLTGLRLREDVPGPRRYISPKLTHPDTSQGVESDDVAR